MQHLQQHYRWEWMFHFSLVSLLLHRRDDTFPKHLHIYCVIWAMHQAWVGFSLNWRTAEMVTVLHSRVKYPVQDELCQPGTRTSGLSLGAVHFYPTLPIHRGEWGQLGTCDPHWSSMFTNAASAGLTHKWAVKTRQDITRTWEIGWGFMDSIRNHWN